MHPLLFQLGPIPVHTYGFLVAIGFLSSVFTIRRLAAKANLPVERILDLTFWCFLVGFAGARLLFVLTRWETFLADPLAIFKIWEGGLVFFGGIMTALPFGIWYLKKYQLPVWKVMDTTLPGLTIAHMFGRFGCLSAGCCYGKPTGTDFGIRLNSDLVDPAFRGILLHPTQLYEAVSLLILFATLIWLFPRKKFDGQVALTYFLAYPVIRSIIEIYRGDLIRGFVIPDVLSTSQFISLLVFIGAAVAMKVRLDQVQKVPVGKARK
ncbi:prolipoprotein diacylglyceryl transferase [bacterium]|jgi:phosphatidylglycerol:prolipoprotein diacylglycerol transferase|nr:prolipoprotein diacylglyceryl transferase [bacterium]